MLLYSCGLENQTVSFVFVSILNFHVNAKLKLKLYPSPSIETIFSKSHLFAICLSIEKTSAV